MKGAYYNEIDPIAAEWLRRLIAAGHIAAGDVDERSIVDVRPADLRGYRQCHFFAGIGVWSYALRRAGWDDEREVWTGSCPCQPFSDAGAGEGFDDERHLFPAWSELIRECRPRAVFGEQVASKDGLAWLDLVHADLEAAGYTVGAVDLCAAGVGAPHIRQRFFFVADAHGGRAGRDSRDAQRASPESEGSRHQHRSDVTGQPIPCGAVGELADYGSIGRERRPHAERPACEEAAERCEGVPDAERSGDAGGVGDSDDARREGDGLQPLRRERQGRGPHARAAGSGAVDELGDTSSRGRGECGDAARPGRGGHADCAVEPCGVALGDTERTRLEGHAGHVDDRNEPGRLAALAAGSIAEAGAARGGVADDDEGGRAVEPSARLHDRGQPGHDADGRGPTNGFWRDAVWIPCRDGKARPIEPGTFPLAHGAPARVGRLRAYGNAINAEAAREFILAYLDVRAAA